MTDMDQTSNNKKALDFILSFRPEGNINLVAIDKKNKITTGITKDVEYKDDLSAFIEKHNGTNDLYYMVNEPHAIAPNKKLLKSDVNKLHGLWVDADPHPLPASQSSDEQLLKQHQLNERKRLLSLADDLKALEHPPTYIIDSGRGIQALWLLEQPIKKYKDTQISFEGKSLHLANTYHTDHVQNIDRIMRLPYTINTKNGNLSKVIHADSKHGTRYKNFDWCPVDELPERNEVSHIDLDMNYIKSTISELTNKRLEKAIANSNTLQRLYEDKVKAPSRSEKDFLLASTLKREGFAPNDIGNIMFNFPHGKGSDLTKREISRCITRAEDDFKLPDETVKQIEQQDNPNDPTLKVKSRAKRLKAIQGSKSDWRLSGEPLIKGLIDKKSIAVVYGQSNVGKSFVATDMAGHVAQGTNWGEHKVREKMGVLYICAEAGMSYGRRLSALRSRLGVPDGASLKEWPFEYVAMGVNLLNEKDDVQDIVALVKEQEEKSGVRVGLVVIDTLATTFSGGNENSSEDMGRFIDNMKWIQEAGECAVLIVHHSGKDQAAGARGHSSLRAATDTELEVKSDSRGEREYREIKVKKQREGRSNEVIEFALSVHILGIDDDGDEVTTCNVILPTDQEFTSVIPSIFEGLDYNQACTLKSIYYVDKLMQNPDINLVHDIKSVNKSWTEKAYKCFIAQQIAMFPDEYNIAFNTEKMSVHWKNAISNLRVSKIPTEGEKKTFINRAGKLSKMGLTSQSCVYKGIQEKLEKLESDWKFQFF